MAPSGPAWVPPNPLLTAVQLGSPDQLCWHLIIRCRRRVRSLLHGILSIRLVEHYSVAKFTSRIALNV